MFQRRTVTALFATSWMLFVSGNVTLAQVTKQPFEKGDLLPFIDVGNPKFTAIGNWTQDNSSLTVGANRREEAHSTHTAVLPFETDGSPFVLEIDVERLAPGELGIGLPIRSENERSTVVCAFDHDGRFSGPMSFDNLGPAAQQQVMGKKAPSREFKKGLLPNGRKVTISCDVSRDRIVAKVGTITAFDFPVELTRIRSPQHFQGSMFLEVQSGQFRFTRIHVTGKGIVRSIGPQGTVTPRVAEVAEAAPARPQLPPPRPLAAPIADLTVGTWKIKPLSDHQRYRLATLHIVSSQKGDVRGVLQWFDPVEKGWAFEILHGQIAGNQITLAGIDLQAMGVLSSLGRYPGEISPDGKALRKMRTILDGRRIHSASDVEIWEADWEGQDAKLEPRTREAFDRCFRVLKDEEAILWQFTEYRHTTQKDDMLILRGHRADRLVLPELAKSTNPRVATAALAMMQSENLRDLKNGIANVANAIEQIEQDVVAYRQEIERIDQQLETDNKRAMTLGDIRERDRALVAANSQHVANTFAAFSAMFDTPGARSLQLNDIERLRISIRGSSCNQIINQQILALLKERPAPEKPLNKSWGVKPEAGLAQTTLLVTNTSKTTFHNCVFLTEFRVDQKKIKTDWDRQMQMMPGVNAMLGLLSGVSSDVLERGNVDTNLTYELLSHDSGYCVVLPEWKPGEQLRIHLGATSAVKYGRSSSLHLWTDETGLQETRISSAMFNDALRKLPAGAPNSLKKK